MTVVGVGQLWTVTTAAGPLLSHLKEACVTTILERVVTLDLPCFLRFDFDALEFFLFGLLFLGGLPLLTWYGSPSAAIASLFSLAFLDGMLAEGGP